MPVASSRVASHPRLQIKLRKSSERPELTRMLAAEARYKLTPACVGKRGGSAGYESESRARTIPVDRGDFSGVHRARGRYAADDCAAEAGSDEFGEEPGSAVGRSFRESRDSDSHAHFAGHAFYGAWTVAIRARVACKISAGSPLVRTNFFDRQRRRGSHRADHGVRKNDWRHRRESGDHAVWNFFPDRIGESAVASTSARV